MFKTVMETQVLEIFAKIHFQRFIWLCYYAIQFYLQIQQRMIKWVYNYYINFDFLVAELVNLLLNAGGNPCLQNKIGESPITLACTYSLTKFAIQLIERGTYSANVNHNKGINLNEKYNMGQTLLHKSIQQIAKYSIAGQSSKDALLLFNTIVDKGADLNIEDDLGVTPLILASKFGLLDVASQLASRDSKRSLIYLILIRC